MNFVPYLYFLLWFPCALSHHVITSLRTDVTLPCDVSKHVTNEDMDKILSNTVWLLPSGELANQNEEKRVSISNDNTTVYLTIKRLNESDLGVYYCIKVFNDSTVETTQYTLDRNVPYYAALRSEMKKNAIIGGVSGGALLLLICLVYIIWYYRCSERMKRKRKILEDLQKGKNRFSTQLYDNVGFDMYAKRT